MAEDSNKAPKAKEKLSPERKKKQEHDDLREIMNTAPGRRHVWKILVDSGIYRTSFVYQDPHATSYNEGRRSLGLKLFADLHTVCPGSYHQMVLENSDESK